MSSIKKPITPVVEAIGRLSITGNTIPHVWYQRSEFRTDANRPDRNMITIVSDIVYWYRPREVRNEEEGGIFVGYERKFARDKLQYNYERRGAVFGMSDREVSDASDTATGPLVPLCPHLDSAGCPGTSRHARRIRRDAARSAS